MSQRNRIRDQKKDASAIQQGKIPNTGTNEKNRDGREAPVKTTKTRRRRMEEKQRTLRKTNSPSARGRTASKQTKKKRRKRRTHEEASGGSTRRALEVPSSTTAWSR